MNKVIEAKDFDEIKIKIKNLLTQEGFDDVEVKGFCGGGENRIDNLSLTVEARKSRQKEKVFDK